MTKLHYTCSNISYQYEEAQLPLIENLSVTFSQGWTAFVGANGTGKSTLLKLICDLLPLQRGVVSTHLFTLYVPQLQETIPENLEELLDSYDKSAIQYKEILGLGYDWPNRWETLSCGEQKRAQVGSALYTNPDLLAIDEPTNHLDSESVSAITKALNEYKGIGLLVSHDRDLLQSLDHQTLLFHFGRISFHPCGWEEAVKGVEEKQQASETEAQNIKKEMKKIKREELKRRDAARQAKGKLSKRAIHKGDHDAKAKIDAARLTSKDRTDARVADRLASRGKHLQEKIADTKYQKKYQSHIILDSSNRHKKELITVEAGTIEINPTHRISFDKMHLLRGDRVALCGPNGIGKTTFVERVLEKGVKPSVSKLYIPQEISTTESAQLLKEIRGIPNKKQGELFTIIRRLGSNPKQLLSSIQPSPGEVRKLMLAQAIVNDLDLIILDEPTNHLDLITRQALEEALVQFGGGLLFVSHDSFFVDTVATHRLEFQRTDELVIIKES